MGPVLPNDERRLECVLDDLPLPSGGQVAVDCTLVSPLRRSGVARPKAHREEGVALQDSRRRKEKRYPELCQPNTRCALVVAGMEVGGRWSSEARDFLRSLATARSRDAPTVLRGAAYRAWLKRWTDLLAVAGMRAFADTLLFGHARSADASDGVGLTLGQLLGEEPHCDGPEVSRLPLRG